MTDPDPRLDGNALAGVFNELFAREMTSVRVACEACGQVEPVGAEHAYTRAPGVVMRCCHCEEVLLVITQRREGYLLGFQRVRWLELT